MKRWFAKADSLFEYTELVFLALMTLVVGWQVFTRYVMSSPSPWTTQVALILMIWVGFMGIAVGFRENSHIAIEILMNRMPEVVQRWAQRVVYALSCLFGLYLVVQGWAFTRDAMDATLPGTGLPRAVLYAVVPIAGAMIVIYTALQLLGFRTERHPESLGGDEAGAALDGSGNTVSTNDSESGER